MTRSVTAFTLGCLVLALVACSDASTPLDPSTVVVSSNAPPPPSPSPVSPTPATTARYRVVFESTWSQATHPHDFPGNAHFSGLIGGTHRSAVSFWTPGAPASAGIQSMAERGSKVQLQEEVERAIAAGTARQVLSGDALAASPGSISMEFGVSQEHPLVTLVTMVAPSPDWFVGVGGLALFDNGDWKREVAVELFAYDAGTDSGITYASPDEQTRPRQNITRIMGFPLLNGASVLPVGTFRFLRLD